MPISAEQARFVLELTVPTIKNESGITERMIRSIPEESADYKPHDVSLSAVDLAWHIASAEHFFLSSVVAGEFKTGARPRPEGTSNATGIADWYGERTAANVVALQALSGEQLLKILDFRGLFQLPAFAYLDFAIHHTIHHRGQLSTYLRAAGVRVPSVYGESYDDARARAAS